MLTDVKQILINIFGYIDLTNYRPISTPSEQVSQLYHSKALILLSSVSARAVYWILTVVMPNTFFSQLDTLMSKYVLLAFSCKTTPIRCAWDPEINPDLIGVFKGLKPILLGISQSQKSPIDNKSFFLLYFIVRKKN